MREYFERKFFVISPASAAAFVLIWGCTGFSTGVLTLMGPVRLLSNIARSHNLGESAESAGVKLIIIAFFIAATLASLYITKYIIEIDSLFVRAAVPLICILAAAATFKALMRPEILGALRGRAEVSHTATFTFGPYPDGQMLRKLKHDGYTSVISLLHPAVVPFEPELIKKEKDEAAEAGIEFIHTPMLPWVSENKESIRKLEQIASHPKGRYYVHCYLGKDRIRIAKSVIDRVSAPGATAEYHEGRSIFKIKSFERGAIFLLPDKVILSPYPTDEEFGGYVLNGSIKTVVSLLDPDSPEDAQWVAKEKKIEEVYKIPIVNIPIKKGGPFDTGAILAAAAKIRGLPKPLLVHEFRTDTPVAQAFKISFLTGLPALSPRALSEPMKGGSVRLLAQNIATGPRPTGPEFGAFLYMRGVRNFIFAGPANSTEAREDMAATAEANLPWRAEPVLTDKLAGEMAATSTWYIYGPAAEQAEETMEKHKAKPATH